MALWDRRSPASKPEHYDRSQDEAWKFDRDPGHEPSGAWAPGDLERACGHFDQYWNLRQLAGEILAWNAVSGVYKVELRSLAGAPRKRFSKAQKAAFLAGQDVERILLCPSGELVVGALKDLGRETAKTILRVPPGDYRVGLDVDKGQVSRHQALKSLADYPADDGPDFVLHLQGK